MGQILAATQIMGSRAFHVASLINRLVVSTVSLGAALLVIGLAVFGFEALDRRAPFGVESISRPAARPGEAITFEARVWRDPGRRCDVEVLRYVWVQTDLSGDPPVLKQFLAESRSVPAEEVARRHAAWPGKNQFSITVPAEALPGPAVVVTYLDYTCNTAHRVLSRPVRVSYEAPFTVLAKGAT